MISPEQATHITKTTRHGCGVGFLGLSFVCVFLFSQAAKIEQTTPPEREDPKQQQQQWDDVVNDDDDDDDGDGEDKEDKE